MGGVSESAGRYQRSAAGMVGAMLVTIGVIVAFVAFRSLNRDDLEVEREPVDYLSVVQAFQDGGGLPIVYPPELPKGWKAVDAGGESDGGWSVDLFTDEDRYVGLFQAHGDVESLVHSYVDENATEGDPVRLDGDLSGRWRTYTDEGGDVAVARTFRDTTVLVVGPGESQVHTLASSLTAEEYPVLGE